MKRFLTIGAIALLSLAACNQQPTLTSKVVGTLELTLGESGTGKAVLRPLASTPVADSAITIGVINSTYGVDSNYRYVRAQVNLTANQAFSNLTLYAYNKTGNQGGTALKNLVNFTGGNTNAEAQSLIPVHSRNASGAYIPDTQDFQAFSSTEASNVQSAAQTANIIQAGETVLQYGFVARRTPTFRFFNTSDTGVVNVAYRIPNTQTTDTYKFVATFIVVDESERRVTRDIDETTSQADTRANALTPTATEVALMGIDSDTTSVLGASTVRINSANIGAEAEVYLENFDAIGTSVPTNWQIYTGATSSTLGTSSTFNTAQTTWAETSGRFKNFSSASCSPENPCTNRALGIRQTGAFGDPGASFVYTLSNTTRFINYKAQVQAQMLSVQTRSTVWTFDYRVGSNAFTTLATYSDLGTFGSTAINGTLGADANNQIQQVEFRISALSTSTGGGSRDSFGIDDFRLRATPVIP